MKYFALCLVLCSYALRTYAIYAADKSVLQHFWTQNGGKYWKRNQGWHGFDVVNDTEEPCKDWYGVKCDESNLRVTKIVLPMNNVTGPFPPALSGLASLDTLDLSFNGLAGAVPSQTLSFPNLVYLSLRGNQLYGSLDFSKFPKLIHLLLDFNHLSGPIDTICKCMNLKVLSLTGNSFSGEVPDYCIKRMTSLQVLQIGNNNLEGTLEGISLPLLRTFDVSRNSFTGSPMAALSTITNLTDVMLFNNVFTGPIQGFSRHQHISLINVANNSLDGDIPDDYATSMPYLLYLLAQNNNIHGFVPWDFEHSTIPIFDFSNNALYCPIPKLPPGGHATCGSWYITSVDPARCTLGGKCVVSVYGQGFIVGQKAFCVFGDITTVAANVVSDSELDCIVVPTKAGKVNLFITVYGLSVTTNSVPFEFVASNKKLITDGKKVPANSNAPAVSVRIHGMSKDANLGTILKFFAYILSSLGSDVVDIDLGFVMRTNRDYPTGFWAPNGQSEVIGNAMILCAKKLSDVSIAIQFATCLTDNADIVPSNAEMCAKTLSLDYDALRQCVMSDDGKQLLKNALTLTLKDSVSWSPTVVIEDKIFCSWGGAPCNATVRVDFLRAVCRAYRGEVPDICKKP